MNKLLSVFCVIGSCALAGSSLAGDVDAGATKAEVCLACHGMDGIGKQPAYPNLRGQKEVYLLNQLKAFRDGQRIHPMMTSMALPLSDTDIENLAAYYSNLK